MTANVRRFRCAIDPPRRRQISLLQRAALVAVLVAAGIIGQRIADAFADARRWNDPYEMWQMLDWFASDHRAASCPAALSAFRKHVAGSSLGGVWDRAYQTVCFMDGDHPVLVAISPGRDREFGTPDDVVVTQAVRR
jgi:hypothetical protein